MEFRSAELRPLPSTADAGESSTLRAFALLERIATAEESPTLEELTRASGLPKPTVHRMLRLLMRGGLVEREIHDKRYAVGARVCALSLAVQMRSPRRHERRAVLARLVDRIGETCNLTMLDGDEVVYLERVETSASVRLHMKAGSRVPLHCTASGKLMLAAMSIAQAHRLLGPPPLKRYTERTIVTMEALERELAHIRASDVGIDNGEYLDGSVCLAVPVRDARGRLCAGIAVHGPEPRVTVRKAHTFLAPMREAAAAIAATLVPAGEEDHARPAAVRTTRTKGIAA